MHPIILSRANCYRYDIADVISSQFRNNIGPITDECICANEICVTLEYVTLWSACYNIIHVTMEETIMRHKKSYYFTPSSSGYFWSVSLGMLTSNSWSFTFTSVDSPLRVVHEFDLTETTPGTWRLLVNARIFTNRVS